MSRELPERPDLDHLRRQAKTLLRELRRQDPRTQLSAAQRQLAREYGFASWRELKSHVLSLTNRESEVPLADYAFTRYTSKARQALFFSRDEAARVGSASIDLEHVLLGSLRAGLGSKARIFDRARVSLDAARAEVMAGPAGVPIPSSVEIPFSGVTKRVLLDATGQARRLGHESIGIVHLVLAMLDRRESRAGLLLTRWGITPERVREGIAELLDEESK
jgi:hypothetical protein